MVCRMWHGNQQGYALIGMLVLLMISGFALAQSGMRWREEVRREREQELLKIGEVYRKAIGSYYNQTPGTLKQYPTNLEALLNDERFTSPRHHIRKLYTDPTTQRDGWGIVEAPSGGVMGIYSLSDKPPFKTKSFRPHLKHLEDRKYYGEWYFVYVPAITLN